MSDPNQGSYEEEDAGINPDEIVQVIELNDETEKDFKDSDNEEEDEMETDGAEAGPVQDDSRLTFSGHRGSSVICTRLNPVNPELAVTGGQDDRAFVWNTRDGSVIFECTGHTDTVSCVGFSCDGALLATADMKGFIQVWRSDTSAQVWSFEASEVEWIQWHQAAPVLVAGTNDGQVWMWKVPSGDLKTMVGHGPGVTCGTILHDGKQMFVGYDDGVMKIFDLKSSQALHTISGHEGHKGSVLCVDHSSSSNAPLVITGSADMTAKLTNTLTGKVVSTLPCHETTEDDSVEAVAFSRTHDYAITGTLGGSLQIWDLPTKSVRHKCEHPFGVVKIAWSPNDATFYTSCLDGNVRQFDSRNGQVVKTWQGHVNSVLDFDIARDNSILVTASDDSLAKVFQLSQQQR